MTTLPVYPVVKWDNPVYDGFSEYYLRSRLYNIRPITADYQVLTALTGDNVSLCIANS